MIRLFVFILFLSLTACSPARLMVSSELQQGKRFFDLGYYKRAMNQLLPLACDGNAEAQYAIGYMYYYGLGVTQDTNVGYFWIGRSAKKGFKPAVEALKVMDNRPIPEKDDQTKLLITQ